MTPRAECPECAAGVPLPDDVVDGEIVQCGECGVALEVVRDGGVPLRTAP